MYKSKPMFDNSLRSPRGGRSFIRLAGRLLVLAAAIGSCWPYPQSLRPKWLGTPQGGPLPPIWLG